MYAGAPNLSSSQSFTPLATSPAGIAQSTVCPSGCSSVSGLIDDLLSFDVYLYDGGQYTFQAYMLAQITVGAGSIDLSHTGKLLITTDDGLQLNPLDENFLSNPAYNVSATPLPATLPIFASGLGGLGLLGLWRKKRKTT